VIVSPFFFSALLGAGASVFSSPSHRQRGPTFGQTPPGFGDAWQRLVHGPKQALGHEAPVGLEWPASENFRGPGRALDCAKMIQPGPGHRGGGPGPPAPPSHWKARGGETENRCSFRFNHESTVCGAWPGPRLNRVPDRVVVFLRPNGDCPSGGAPPLGGNVFQKKFPV